MRHRPATSAAGSVGRASATTLGRSTSTHSKRDGEVPAARGRTDKATDGSVREQERVVPCGGTRSAGGDAGRAGAAEVLGKVRLPDQAEHPDVEKSVEGVERVYRRRRDGGRRTG